MPKPFFHEKEKNTQDHAITQRMTQPSDLQTNKMLQARLLRRPRSRAYMDALHQLDAGGHLHNQEKVDAIIQAIQDEFPEICLAGLLIGYISICYLGKPYEVHTLTLDGSILEHYKQGQPLPAGFEKARSIALNEKYDFIEVYSDCCRAVCKNCMVYVIPN